MDGLFVEKRGALRPMPLSRRRQFTASTTSRDRQRRFHRTLVGPERLDERLAFASVPFGAMPDDTAEFLLGDVSVTVVLMESSPQTSATNNNSENWTPATIAAVKQRVEEGLQWWEDSLAAITDKQHLNFQIDYTYADQPVLTTYEPITRSSNDFQFWIYDFLNKVGYNTRGNYHSDIRAFNDAQRTAHQTDWAYTIFVVNDEQDADHLFAPGGFSRAFAFAGGEFLVSLASRPASTYAHETGHIFWAYDEYRPDGNVDRRRGYYDTQNLNSWDNPTPGFVQQPSIMTKDQLLTTAYETHTSATSTLEMVGWKDSDGDGVFDVLDVPLSLSGSGYYDEATGEYVFTGASAVQTLPNKNLSGLKNDITLNQVSRAQYRVDGGPWQTAAVYGASAATLQLRFAVPPTATSVEIRTIDDTTGVSSPVFRGLTSRPSSVDTPGIGGVVWRDVDRDGVLDANERGLANVTVQLVDASGQPLPSLRTIEPDNHASATRLNTIESTVTMSAIGSGVADDSVSSLTAPNTSTGDRLFASFSSSCGGYCSDWTTESRQLRLDFTTPISTLSLDAIGSTMDGIGRLEIYGSDNRLLARYTTAQLAAGQIETMTLKRQTADIKYAIAHSHNNTVIRFDNLRFGPESTTTTDANGTYTLGYLKSGQYRVRVVPSVSQASTNPSDGSQNIILAEGEAKTGVDFGIDDVASAWQNPRNRFDVNDDGLVTSNDVLRIINKLNTEGAGELGQFDGNPPFVDVNGDFQVTSNDVLQVINEINRRASSGEGEFARPTGGSSSMSTGAAAGEASDELAQHAILWVAPANHSGASQSESTLDSISGGHLDTDRVESGNDIGLISLTRSEVPADRPLTVHRMAARLVRQRWSTPAPDLFGPAEFLVDDTTVSLLAEDGLQLGSND